MPTTKEEKAAYNREYYRKNKERIKKQSREYYDKNKEERNEYNKEYREANKDKIAKRMKEYFKEHSKTPQWIKSNLISTWKFRGLVCDDYDDLYDKYLASTNCEECAVEYGEFGCGEGTWKCMDHDHVTGEFRNFICCKCNLKRK